LSSAISIKSYKLTPILFAGWMRILKKAPGSVLWLLESNASFAGNIRREAASTGVGAGAYCFRPMIAT